MNSELQLADSIADWCNAKLALPVVDRPIFYTVTGRDFARSITWAKDQPANPVTTALRENTIRGESNLALLQ